MDQAPGTCQPASAQAAPFHQCGPRVLSARPLPVQSRDDIPHATEARMNEHDTSRACSSSIRCF